jgi:hypothetical protein
LERTLQRGEVVIHAAKHSRDMTGWRA